MCHFDLTAQELGLKGKWSDEDPGMATDDNNEYIITYIFS